MGTGFVMISASFLGEILPKRTFARGACYVTVLLYGKRGNAGKDGG
jgi:hypothetical protein